MDLVSILFTLISLGVVILLGGFLLVGVLILLYLAITGKRWD